MRSLLCSLLLLAGCSPEPDAMYRPDDVVRAMLMCEDHGNGSFRVFAGRELRVLCVTGEIVAVRIFL